MTILRKDHSILLEYKLINNEPFVEATIFKNKQPQDATTFSIIEKEILFKIIEKWMYEQQG